MRPVVAVVWGVAESALWPLIAAGFCERAGGSKGRAAPAERANFLTSQPLAYSIHRLMARAANTIVRWASGFTSAVGAPLHRVQADPQGLARLSDSRF